MKKFLFNVPLGRLSHPSDVANYCLFLASDEAKFITGTCLEVRITVELNFPILDIFLSNDG